MVVPKTSSGGFGLKPKTTTKKTVPGGEKKKGLKRPVTPRLDKHEDPVLEDTSSTSSKTPQGNVASTTSSFGMYQNQQKKKTGLTAPATRLKKPGFDS